MPAKAPQRLLTRAQLEELTGWERKKVLKMLRGEWLVPGGTKLLGTEYRLPEAFYNAWVDSKDVAPKPRCELEAACA